MPLLSGPSWKERRGAASRASRLSRAGCTIEPGFHRPSWPWTLVHCRPMGFSRHWQAVLWAAVVTLVCTVGVLYVPARAQPIECNLPQSKLAADGTVTCGSFILQSDYATDGRCEAAILKRVGQSALAGVTTVLLAITGGVLCAM